MVVVTANKKRGEKTHTNTNRPSPSYSQH